VSHARAAAVVGPTASGKSALAHELARELGSVEILAVDSMTVYRGMDVGTAKATAAQRAEVPYHLVDLVEPDEEFTLAQFQAAARAAAEAASARGHGVLYVGGTGLYARAVLDQLEIPGRYPAVRAELEARLPDALAELHARLTALDPVAAARMEPTNARRVVRALEVTLGSGRPFSSFGAGLGAYPARGVAQVALRVSDAEIDRRIEVRLARWMADGLLEEVETLARRPGGLSRTARQAVGYRELLEHVEDGVALEVALERATAATRRLARRQRKWFQRDPRVEWFEDPADARARLRELLVGTGPGVGH
jgi:tRNA dimethylallyltransferase